MDFTRSPLAAALLGAVLAAAAVSIALGYAIQSYGGIIVYAMIIVGPVLPGFIVGVLAGRDGDKWASVSAGFFIVGMAVYTASSDPNADPVSAFMMSVGLGAIGVGLAAVTGKLGEMSAQLRPVPRKAASAAVLLLVFGAPTAYWFDTYAKIRSFRREVLPVVQQHFSDHVVRLPADMKWTIEHASLPLWGGYPHIIAVSDIRGHRLFVRVSPEDGIVQTCMCGYEPNRPMKLADEKAAKAYLKEFGVSKEIVDRLEFRRIPMLVGRSWFCPHSLTAGPAQKPCTNRASCGEDMAFTVLENGNIRLGRYYRPWSR